MKSHFLSQRLEAAIQVFRADQTILRVIREEQIEDGASGVDSAQGIGLHLHAFGYRGGTRRSKIGSTFDFDHAYAA